MFSRTLSRTRPQTYPATERPGGRWGSSARRVLAHAATFAHGRPRAPGWRDRHRGRPSRSGLTTGGRHPAPRRASQTESPIPITSTAPTSHSLSSDAPTLAIAAPATTATTRPPAMCPERWPGDRRIWPQGATDPDRDKDRRRRHEVEDQAGRDGKREPQGARPERRRRRDDGRGPESMSAQCIGVRLVGHPCVSGAFGRPPRRDLRRRTRIRTTGAVTIAASARGESVARSRTAVSMARARSGAPSAA